MKDNTQVFESYSVPRAVRTLALPSMMGMLVNIVYNLADTFFVGQTGNANMVAAVSVTMPLFLLFIACGNLFGVGGCAFVSRSLGEGKTERVKTISSFCVYSAIGVGLVMTVLFLVFRKPVLYAVGASDATFAYAADYLKYVAIGSSFIVSSVMLGNLVRGEGAARVSMIGSIIGQVVNIVLDPIFILNKGDKLFGLAMPFGTGQGVAGRCHCHRHRQCGQRDILLDLLFAGQVHFIHQPRPLSGAGRHCPRGHYRWTACRH